MEENGLVLPKTQNLPYEPIQGSATSPRRKFLLVSAVVALLVVVGCVVGFAVHRNSSEAARDPSVTITSPGLGINAVQCSRKLAKGFHNLKTLSNRKFELYYRDDLPDNVLHPVIFMWHGINSDPAKVEAKALLKKEADVDNWILVYPVGVGLLGAHNGMGCCDKNAGDDVTYAKEIINFLESEGMCVDTHNVFSTGFSNGGFMSHRLGCEAGLRPDGYPWFKAIAPHSGLIGDYSGSLPAVTAYTGCKPGHKVPVLSFHGRSDETVGYDGYNPNPFSNAKWYSFENTFEVWKIANGCDKENHVEDPYSSTTTCRSVTSCNVRFCTINNLKHDWSGNGNSEDIRASKEIIAFFKGLID